MVAPAPSTAVATVARAPRQRPNVRVIHAKYDAAQTSDDSKRHWAQADALSARTANSLFVRSRLRMRARYEVANNSYAKGIVLTLANDVIGTGPRLQLLTPDVEVNRTIEKAWAAWADEIHLGEKLLTASQCKTTDGEVFALLVTNPALSGPVQLDIRLMEGDQVHTLWLNPADPYQVDGIQFDSAYNPIFYNVMRQHPGDFVAMPWMFDQIPARSMIHWFRSDRPHQFRGVPDITPALPLFAQLRRYTLATVAAAETAANFAALIQSTMPADDADEEVNPFDTQEIERNLMTFLPAGYTAQQMRAEQPTGTYAEFKREILNEIARCLNMPYNIAACNSSTYNYSSGRLDHQTYYKSLRIERSQVECIILDRLFTAWLDEMSLATDLIPDGPSRLAGWPHRWFWDGHAHVDPMKEATAQQIKLDCGMTTYSDEWARVGEDGNQKIEEWLNERQRIRDGEIKRGLSPIGSTPAAPVSQGSKLQPQPNGASDGDTEEEE